MAGSTIWKGIIHFGDTDVPVKLHTAVKEEWIQFHLLHKRDQVRVRQQMVCAYEKQPVPAEEQSKGFQPMNEFEMTKSMLGAPAAMRSVLLAGESPAPRKPMLLSIGLRMLVPAIGVNSRSWS